MKTRRIGKIEVSEIGMGCMGFSHGYGTVPEEVYRKEKKMEEKAQLFSNKDLRAMIVPLFMEQLLVMLVGMADTLVVSYTGEDAVSGVSLVNQFNTIFIYSFLPCFSCWLRCWC